MRMKAKETVCFNIKACWHQISRMYNEEGAEHGLTASVGYVLLNIDEKEGTPATRIGPLIGMEPRSLTRMLKNLEAEGLIERKPSENDRRLVIIHLTEKGKSKRNIARQVVKKFNLAVKERIPEQKLKHFYEVVDEINSIIEQKNIF